MSNIKFKKGDILICKKTYQNVFGKVPIESGQFYTVCEISSSCFWVKKYDPDSFLKYHNNSLPFRLNSDKNDKFYVKNYFYTPIEIIKNSIEKNFKHHINVKT